MQVIRKYRILSATLIADLVADVNEAIEVGWQPIGGPMAEVNHIDGQTYFDQAIVMMEDDKSWYTRLSKTIISSVKQGERDKKSLRALYGAISFLGGIWTYPGRDAENQSLYEACRELESMGRLESTNHLSEPFEMFYFRPV